MVLFFENSILLISPFIFLVSKLPVLFSLEPYVELSKICFLKAPVLKLESFLTFLIRFLLCLSVLNVNIVLATWKKASRLLLCLPLRQEHEIIYHSFCYELFLFYPILYQFEQLNLSEKTKLVCCSKNSRILLSASSQTHIPHP